MIYLVGKDVLLNGIKTYFEKYSYKNTELKDFIAEMDAAVKQGGKMNDFDFATWTDTWLKTPGCNEIEIKYELDKANKITKF
jgi:aminopeptidase N